MISLTSQPSPERPNSWWRPTPKGVSWAMSATGLTAVAAGGIYYIIGGVASMILFMLAASPAIIILSVLRSRHEKDIPLQLYTEQFLCGCVISIGLATVIEALAQLNTLQIWRCEKDPRFTIQCDVLFVLVVTVSVGLTEEFCKFLPITRLKSRNQTLSPLANWWRTADTPFTYLLAGCAAGAGFACIENISYAMKTGDTSLAYGINTSIFRAVLAFPFHIACTGYATSMVAYRQYVVPGRIGNEKSRPSNLRFCWNGFTRTLRNWLGWSSANTHHPHPRSTNEGYTLMTNASLVDPLTTNSGNQTPINVAPSSDGGSTRHQMLSGNNYVPFAIYQPATPLTYLKMLAVPAVLHGLYDSGLFLAAQFMAQSVRADRLAEHLNNQFHFVAAETRFLATMAGGHRWSPTLSSFLGLLTTIWPLADWQGLWNAAPAKAGQQEFSILKRSDAFQEFEKATRESQVFVGLGYISTGVSLVADITMLVLFVYNWRRLSMFQRNAVPKIHPSQSY